MIAVASNEVGNTENPAGSNKVKYWEVMPSWNGQPWCVVFLLWCFRKAGEAMAIFGGAFTASCSTLLAWYKSQGQVVPMEDVQPGDIVMLNFHSGTSPEHCGLVYEVVRDSYGKLVGARTYEGNTSKAGSQSNGGMVCDKDRLKRQIVGVCRPTYKEEDEVPKNDYENHWAEQHIRWAMEEGLIRGYPDGNFRPDQPVTRAELATILHRYHAKEGVK